jgi:hypothetical protein
MIEGKSVKEGAQKEGGRRGKLGETENDGSSILLTPQMPL